jgi:protein gp37
LNWQILTKRADRIVMNLPDDWGQGYPNVWLGVTVENNDYVWRFNNFLAPLPAAVRFISHEPALGPLPGLDMRKLDWYIFGGESGSRFRPMDFQWARDKRQECEAQNVAFFYKQTAGKGPVMSHTLDGEIVRAFPTPRILPSKTLVQRTLGLYV